MKKLLILSLLFLNGCYYIAGEPLPSYSPYYYKYYKTPTLSSPYVSEQYLYYRLKYKHRRLRHSFYFGDYVTYWWYDHKDD